MVPGENLNILLQTLFILQGFVDKTPKVVRDAHTVF